MFKVGKVYRYNNMSNQDFNCLAVVGDVGWLKAPGAKSGFLSAFGLYWEEIPPEPKRWSEWANLKEYNGYRVLGKAWASLSEASAYVTANCYTIRLDWEQHEGKEKRLVKMELVGVPD